MPPLPTTSKATEPTAAAPPVTMGPAAFSGRRTLRAPPQPGRGPLRPRAAQVGLRAEQNCVRRERGAKVFRPGLPLDAADELLQ